ncbi:MAG: hypothetical protein Q8K70_04990 [Bacteroidota bacterium]|nr:hypothetical protein [Bacteroidota bacterium]
MNITSEYMILVLSLLGSIASILLVVIFYIRRQSEMKLKERYDFDKHMVQLEYMRKNMEMQLYDVSRKLEENDKRWMDMNHLVISSQNKSEVANYNKSQVVPNDFLKNFGITSQKDFDVDNRQVFVLTPFNDNYRHIYLTIREVCGKLNLNCIRGDEEYIPNEIFPEMIKQIIKSRLIIANITGRNPNVMYELGVAHALGKPTIVIAQDFTDIPFDLNNKRIIIYKNEMELQRRLESSITDMLINKAL